MDKNMIPSSFCEYSIDFSFTALGTYHIVLLCFITFNYLIFFLLECQNVPSGYSATSSTITSYSNVYASPIYIPVPVSLPSQINQPEPVERLDSKERVSQLEDL
jgi:hypothetical protein